MDLITSRIRKLWKDWDLRLMVLLCLASYTVLILVGSRRKYSHRLWIRIVTWCAYLSSDYLAIMALGISSSQLQDVNEEFGKLDERSRLIAFWAPCLLLLLGGPDNITAYALEDNELWLRHLLGVAVQTGVTAYIYLMAWSVSYLSLLSFLMILAGVIKYGERTWVLWLASSKKRKESMLAPLELSPNYPLLMEDYSLKKAEGYNVTADEIVEVQIKHYYFNKIDSSIKDAEELVKAYHLIQTFKRIFAKLVVSFADRAACREVFTNISWTNAFKITEIELGFMYDMLYTKATVLHSKWGMSRRLITFMITCFVLTSFAVADIPHYKKVDLAITYLLLAVVILMEIYSFAMLLSSDRTDVWLSTTDQSPSFLRAVTSLQLFKQPRWSNSIGQFSFLSFCLEERPLACSRLLKLIKIHDKVAKYHYTLHEEVQAGLKDFIFRHIRARYERPQEGPVGHPSHLTYVLDAYRSQKVKWSTEGPFDQIIITWHVASELCYYLDLQQGIDEMRPDVPYLRLGRLLSRYMFYLLVMYPSMLPSGIGEVLLRDTWAEAMKFFQEHPFNEGKNLFKKKNHALDYSDQLQTYFKATKLLLEVNTELPPSKVYGGRCRSVLFDGCTVASALYEIFGEQFNLKWEMISKLWTEMLLHAAFHCEAFQHAQQLRRGGELITHVWLLLAHFGLTDHFRLTEYHDIFKLILK